VAGAVLARLINERPEKRLGANQQERGNVMAETPHKGFLLVLMQPPPAMEEEFNAWYDTEHIPERCAVPGIESGLRFICVDGFPRFMAMYDLATPEVMQSPAYLRVAHDQSSPWTKRVTSRVKIYRSAGQQIYPGHAVTQRPARVTLLRFQGLAAGASQQIIDGVRANFERRPNTAQVRVFAHDMGGKIDYLAFIEQRQPDAFALDLEVFGAHAAALDLVNTYAPY
jgi:hypothetical protein